MLAVHKKYGRTRLVEGSPGSSEQTMTILDRLPHLLIAGIFTHVSFAYGDLSQHLGENYCRTICLSQKVCKLLFTTPQDLGGQDVSCCDLSTSNLQGANLQDAIALCTNFSNANLSGANLSNANMLGSNFTDANLKGAWATSKFIAVKPRDDMVHTIYLDTPHGLFGLFFHGSDLSKGVMHRYDQVIKRASYLHNY